MKTLLDSGRWAAWLACTSALVLASGCAEVTFKRGAGPGEMQATEQGCRAKSADVEAYKACLHAAGFIYAKPSGDAVLFADEQPTGAADEDGFAVGNAPGPSPTPASGPATTAAESGDAPTVSVAPSGRAGESLPQPPKAAVPADPLKKVTVASWWKLGGTAGGLEADQASCGAQLGDTHTIAPNAKVVTIGMLRCLKGKGWYAVGQ